MIYISPPFGNYISYKNCKRIKGTFTWEKRRGLIKQCIKTIRPVKGGWCNAIGFRNPGMSNIKRFSGSMRRGRDCYSIAALDSNWSPFITQIPHGLPIEINVGCPNVGSYTISDDDIRLFVKHFSELQVKLSPTVDLDYIKRLHSLGVRNFHLSNTIPTNRGGISGYPLKRINLTLVEKTAAMNLEKLHIIAGGGIYRPQDVIDYRNAGTNSYSLSTIWFTPWRVPSVYDEIAFGQ